MICLSKRQRLKPSKSFSRKTYNNMTALTAMKDIIMKTKIVSHVKSNSWREDLRKQTSHQLSKLRNTITMLIILMTTRRIRSNRLRNKTKLLTLLCIISLNQRPKTLKVSHSGVLLLANKLIKKMKNNLNKKDQR